MLTRTLIGVFLYVTFSLAAQEVTQARFEIALHPGQTDPYRTTSLQENGMLLYGRVLSGGLNAIEVIRLDTTFQEAWRGLITLKPGMGLIYSRYFEGRVYMLLKDRFNPQAEFEIISVAAENGNYVSFGVKTLIPFNPSHFEVTEHFALIGGNFNYRPLVLHFSFGTRQSKILPGFFNEPGELDQVRADKEGNINIIVSGKNHMRRRGLWIRNFDREGDLVKTIVLQPEDDKNLLFGKSVVASDGSQVVCGVYGRHTEYSRGVFIASVNPYGEYNINYYNFGDLEKFFSFMKVKRAQRVKERIERRKVRGKKIRLNYRIQVNELMVHDGQVLMLGEAYYPHYSYPSSRNFAYSSGMFSPRYGAMSSRGDLIFDGYQYTHAVVVAFDTNGQLKWDNSFEINDVRTMQLEQFVKILPLENNINLLYLFDNVIRSKTIKSGEVLEGKSYDPLSMPNRDDVVKERDTQQTKLEHWYGDVFYATGIQHIRNLRDKGVNIHRRVFFINRIEYK